MIHSEEYLNDTRYGWYNKDYLDLLAKRFCLEKYDSLADIGCGLGHWHRLLLPYLKKPAKLYAADFEKVWLDRCCADSAFYKNMQCSAEFILSRAEALALPDNCADVVSCQTLLIHTADIKSVLKEFYRITKPGGIAVCAEPNNLITPLMFDFADEDDETEVTLNKLRFELSYARGKEKLGLGKSYAVETIPELMRQSGFKNIRVYMSDKADLYPDEGDEGVFEEIYKNEYRKSLEYYLQVNEDLTDFEKYWKNLKAYYRKKSEGAKTSRLTCKGALMYIMYGEKV